MVIVTEGNDDRTFLISFLQDLRKKNEIKIEDNFDFNKIIETKNSKSKLLNSSNYEKLKQQVQIKGINKILFIFDSDFEKDDTNCNGLEKSKQCFEKLIEELNLEIEIDFYIFDRNLDYFLLTTIDDAKCYENFYKLNECLGSEEIKPNKKPIANMYRELYPHPKFDYKHENFDELKQKLKNLFN